MKENITSKVLSFYKYYISLFVYYISLSPKVFAQSDLASEYPAQSLWIANVVSVISARFNLYIDQITHKIAPLIAWYEKNNILVSIIPSLMTVHILDFALLVLGGFLVGWFVLKRII